jgi:hypothetical protein
VSGRDLRSVSSDADETNQALFARFDGGIDGAAGTERAVPFDGIGQIVQLPQIDAIDLHAVQ